MTNIDGRKLSAEDQYARRQKIIELRKAGKTNAQIAELTGCNISHISTIFKKYSSGGLNEIKSKIRGRKYGEKRLLTPIQEDEIKKLLIENTPEQLGLQYLLWSRCAVHFIIKETYKINLSHRRITDYLKRWGFTPFKPVKIAKQLSACSRRTWLLTCYPQIAAKAKSDNCEIHWVDDKAVNSTPNTSKSNIRMISAISNQGWVRFMLYRNEITDEIFTSFLNNIINETTRKPVCILYRKIIHKSDSVDKWLLIKKSKIDVIYQKVSGL